MGKKSKPKRNEVYIKALDTVKELGTSFFEAAAVNPIMATAGGLLPYVLLSVVAPNHALVGLLAVGGVAGLQSTPSLAISTPLVDFGVSSVQAKWPAQINIIKKDKSMQIDEEKKGELAILLKALGLAALPP